MLMPDRQNSMVSDNAGQAKDGTADVDALLDILIEGRLGGRIADAARLAFARHMLWSAQDMRSVVEAENSSE